jgi:hypothetical protein
MTDKLPLHICCGKNNRNSSSGNVAGLEQDITKEFQCNVPLSYQCTFQKLVKYCNGWNHVVCNNTDIIINLVGGHVGI